MCIYIYIVKDRLIIYIIYTIAICIINTWCQRFHTQYHFTRPRGNKTKATTVASDRILWISFSVPRGHGMCFLCRKSVRCKPRRARTEMQSCQLRRWTCLEIGHHSWWPFHEKIMINQWICTPYFQTKPYEPHCWISLHPANHGGW